MEGIVGMTSVYDFVLTCPYYTFLLFVHLTVLLRQDLAGCCATGVHVKAQRPNKAQAASRLMPWRRIARRAKSGLKKLLTEDVRDHYFFLHAAASDCTECVKYWLSTGADLQKGTQHNPQYNALEWARME